MFPQLAFVAGVLAALRVFRHRGETVLPAAEAAMIVRRCAVGVGAGIATMVGLALIGIEYQGDLAGWWLTLSLVLCKLAERKPPRPT